MTTGLVLVLLALSASQSTAAVTTFSDFTGEGRRLEEHVLTGGVVYDDSNDPYEPSDYVLYGHRLTNEDFEANQDYLYRVLYSPIIIFGLGLLALLFLLLALLFRCCCESCKCLPDSTDEHYTRNKLSNTVVFYLLCLLVLIIDQLVFMGNTEVDKGVTTLNGAVLDTQDLVTTVFGDVVVMGTLGEDMVDAYNHAKTTTCPNAAYLPDIDKYLDTFTSAVDTLSTIVKPINGKFDIVTDYIDQYAMFYRQIALYVVWGLSILCVILFVLSKCVETICGMQFAIVISVFTYIIYLVLGVPWVIVTSIFADICMDPLYNILKSMPKSKSLQETAVYYASCIGNSTLTSSLDKGIKSMAQLNTSINNAINAQACTSNVDLYLIRNALNNVTDRLVTLRDDDLACPKVRQILFDIVNKGVCTELYTGFFYIWGSQLVTSFLLFLLIITATFTYHYYDLLHAGKVVPDADGGHDHDAHKGDLDVEYEEEDREGGGNEDVLDVQYAVVDKEGHF